MDNFNTQQPMTSRLCSQILDTLQQRYPFCRTRLVGRTAFQRPIRALILGSGSHRVLYTAAHHANEWLTATLMLQFCLQLCRCVREDTPLLDTDVRRLLQDSSIHVIPMMDPDGVDLVTGALTPGDVQYALAQSLARQYPDIPFPQGWKANLLGVDLNLNYPAGWQEARRIKYDLGYTLPGPRDYVGKAPLNQLETGALARYTRQLEPQLVLAYHSQGRDIYWRYGDISVPGARELGEEFARLSGYRLTDPPENSSYAGFKDWFIQAFRRPGFTVEVGRGVNPLPVEQFDEIYRDNLPILLAAARPFSEK